MTPLIRQKNVLSILLIALFFLPLHSQNWDIYQINVNTGEVEQITDDPFTNEFNPSYSNNGSEIVFDAVIPFPPFTNFINKVDLNTGVSDFIPGVNDGNDASWSPNGNFIAFDRFGFVLFMIPAEGGTQEFLKVGALDPEWSQDSKKLVFEDLFNGGISTINVETGAETMVSPFGIDPSWSPNGKYIAFSDGNNLWKIKVNPAGEQAGPPVQITFDPAFAFNQQPSWSNNSKTLVFHSNRNNDVNVFDFNIWTVPASGGAPSFLYGVEGQGEFDPAFSKNGKYVAFAGETAPAPLAGNVEGDHPVEMESTKTTHLGQNYPNPFTHETTIEFELEKSGNVLLQIYNQRGALVKTVVNDFYYEGIYKVVWDGIDTNGNSLPNGIYTYSIITEQGQQSNRMVLVR